MLTKNKLIKENEELRTEINRTKEENRLYKAWDGILIKSMDSVYDHLIGLDNLYLDCGSNIDAVLVMERDIKEKFKKVGENKKLFDFFKI